MRTNSCRASVKGYSLLVLVSVVLLSQAQYLPNTPYFADLTHKLQWINRFRSDLTGLSAFNQFEINE